MKPGTPRLTSMTLPTHRFVPGAPWSGPRPHHRPPLSPCWAADPSRWRESLDYLFGVDLFNAGFPWESHEALEVVWNQLRAAEHPHAAAFVRAVIQVAAARIKRETGDPLGVERLRARAGANVALAASAHPSVMGVPIITWWDACTPWFAGEAEGAPPALAPRD